MALFPQSFIDDLRLQANILTVVQEYVPLKRAGRVYKGLCPFHSEKTPSFQVDPERGFFFCFGCHKGGDVFKFVELQENLGFTDIVRLLAQKAGLSLPELTENEDGRRDAALRESLLNAHEVAAAYFREQLAAPAGSRARQQLQDRGVQPETIDQLGLGYAPPTRDGLLQRLRSAGFSDAVMLQSGLVTKRDTGPSTGSAPSQAAVRDPEVVDRFRNRLMIPICRDSGSVIAFGGRQMDKDQGGPKYLNSPETPIYSKGRTLYGLHLSKQMIRKFGYAVMVEGYFDFAQVFQAQAAPVVATCGTALTPQQAQLLRRFTTRVVLSFDPDAAGQGAASRSCELLVREGFEVNVLALNTGEDPDTFIRNHGGEQYRERLRNSRPYLEFLLDEAAAGLNMERLGDRQAFLKKMLTVAQHIPEATVRDQFGDRIAHKARVTEDVVRAEIRKAAVQKRTEVAARVAPAAGALKHAEKGLIWSLIHNTGEALAAFDELEPEDVNGLAAAEVFEVAQTLKENAPRLPGALLQRLSEQAAQMVTGIAATPPPQPPPLECVRALKRLRWERERAAIQREIDRLQAVDAGRYGNEIDALWQKKKDLLHRIEALT